MERTDGMKWRSLTEEKLDDTKQKEKQYRLQKLSLLFSLCARETLIGIDMKACEGIFISMLVLITNEQEQFKHELINR